MILYLARPASQWGDVFRQASGPVSAGETAIHQRQASEVFLKGKMTELKNGDRPPKVADVASFHQDARAPLQQAQEILGCVVSHRVNAGVLLPHALEQADDFVLSELLRALVAHGVGNVLKLWNRLIVIDWLIYLATPVEQHLHCFPVQVSPAVGKLTDFAFDQRQRRQQHRVTGESLNAVGAVDVMNQFHCRRLPPLREFSDGTPATGEVVLVLLRKIGDRDVLKSPPNAVAHFPITDDARRGNDRGVGVGNMDLFDLTAETSADGRILDLVQAIEQQECLPFVKLLPKHGPQGFRLSLRQLRPAQCMAQYIFQ